MAVYTKLFATFLLLSIGLYEGCRQRSRQEVEAIIAKSETLRQIDQVCTEFPMPKVFELEKKSLGGNSRTYAIEYQYIAHMPFEEVKAFYQDQELRRTYGFRNESYLDNFMNEINFRHGEVSINIANRPPSWIVGVYCSSTSQLPVSQRYPPVWFAPINDRNRPDWEVLPRERQAGEFIVLKRNELRIMSYFSDFSIRHHL